MKVLTFGASPYINTNLGRINRSILMNLKEAGCKVASAVWDHDASWYLPDNDRYYFEHNEEKVCQIYPFDNVNMEASATFMYDVIFALNPDMVVTSGDIADMEYTFAIKSLYPEKFKWVAYLVIPSLPINENKIEQLKMIDQIIVSTKKAKSFLAEKGIQSEYCPFGPSAEFFGEYDFPKKEEFIEDLKVVVTGKNSTISNLGNVMFSAGTLEPGISLYVHTNYSDTGEFDLDLLKERYDTKNVIRFPDNFVGLNEGITTEDLIEIYDNADVVLDASARSGTGLSVLEAMSRGCVPVVSNVGALSEIASLIYHDDLDMVGTPFISYGETMLNIVPHLEISNKLNMLRRMKQESPTKFANLKDKAVSVANGFSEKELPTKILEMRKRIFSHDRELKVETF